MEEQVDVSRSVVTPPRAVDLPDELRARLGRLDSALLDQDMWPADAVWLACDLLAAGVDRPGIVALACAPPAALIYADAVPLVLDMLTELGYEPIDPAQPAWVVAGQLARRVISGSMLPEVGVARLYGMWEECGQPWEIGRLLFPLEAWYEVLPAQRDDEAVRAEMRELVQAVVVVAEARTA
ncbi:hypothetical protein AB0I60_12765 [Actinosynnema sp. NPDC050436]|uniref:hypothetical protein n=1 Tax=Actinosynnema sp. NPDC050436 TaxID=3155659 RepID=UPI0033F6BA08